MPVDREHILPQLRYGMDHDHYDWNPLNESRAILKWPNDARIAVCVIVNLEQMEWAQPEDGYRSPTLASGPGPYPDITAWSGREYGHRVGIFRVLDVLDRHGIKPTVAMDTLTAENYPWLVKHHVDRGDEFIGHGISLSRMITSRMSEQEERDYIQTCLTSLNRTTGVTPMGWLGPEFGESARTRNCWVKRNPLCVRLDQRRPAIPHENAPGRVVRPAGEHAAGRRQRPG